MAYFFLQEDFHRDTVPQGVNEWANYPSVNAEMPGLFAARVTIKPGMGHDFHMHPGREEIIYVLQGTIEQWVGTERRTLSSGDMVLVPASKVHASFNAGDGEAVLFVVLTPAQSQEPLAIDVAKEAPWNSLRSNT